METLANITLFIKSLLKSLAAPLQGNSDGIYIAKT